MAQPIISAENVGKRYRLRHQARQPYATLRDALTAQAKRLFGRPSATDNAHADSQEEFWALKDVNFEIQRGDVVGIIGRNGAGKSTLLKVLSRIIEPTAGRITLRGRVASLLEVGTGFHPELTGRENIFLNGAILGMSKREIRSKFDEIVAFAEVEKFLDTPVKHYSSGMYVRLAFAVAAHLEPEILIVDEVLAVGDVEFQKKCLGKMRDVAGGGRTVLFVSHNIGAVSSLCSSAFLLRGGTLVESGPVSGVVAAYAAIARPTGEGFHADGRRGRPSECRIDDAWLVIDGQRRGQMDWNSTFDIVVEVMAERDIALSTEYLIRDNNGLPILFSPTGLQQNITLQLGSGRHRITAACPALGLATGSYTIDLMLVESGVRAFDYCESALQFEVTEFHNRPYRWGFAQTQGQGFMPFAVQVTVETVSAQGGSCAAS
jgi:lipopolysaccharide transport system ATP-binding protein